MVILYFIYIHNFAVLRTEYAHLLSLQGLSNTF